MNIDAIEAYLRHVANELENNDIAVTVDTLTRYCAIAKCRFDPSELLSAAEFVAACYAT